MHEIELATLDDLYDLQVEMTQHVSWMQFLNKRLGLTHGAWYPPTVVLVEEKHPLRGLGLFWALQHHLMPSEGPGSIFLLPETSASNRSVLRRVADLVTSSEIKSNYCHLRSAGEDASVLRKVARSLRPRLRSKKDRTYHVDVSVNFALPVSQCYEEERNLSVQRSGNILSVPKCDLSYARESDFTRWYGDLVKDRKTIRYPFEIALPKDFDLLNLLNLPSGEFLSFRDLVSFGEECLSVSFTDDKNASETRFELPSETEIFSLILNRGKYRMRKDEKNTRYSQALNLFGTLGKAAATLSENHWPILRALAKESLTYDQLQAKAKIGKWKKQEALSGMADIALDRCGGIFRDLAGDRIRTATGQILTKDSVPDTALAFFTDSGVVRRKWLLDRCNSCDREYWQESIDISEPVLCPGCGSAISVKASIRVGYAINELVHLSLTEGMRPVVLTARFLRNLTSHGFLWYPGAKVVGDGFETDMDILSVADGYLIAGECKDLPEVKNLRSAAWDKLAEQLENPIKVAKDCGIHLFVVSSLAQRYPKRLKDRVREMAGTSLRTLFLTGKDLQAGTRHIKDSDGDDRRLTLGEVMAPSTLRSRKKGRTLMT